MGEPIPREDLGTMFDYAVRRFVGGIDGLQKGYSGPADAGIAALDRVRDSLPPDTSSTVRNLLWEIHNRMVQVSRYASQRDPVQVGRLVSELNYQARLASRFISRIATSEPIKARARKAGLSSAAYLNVAHRLESTATALNVFRPEIMSGAGIPFVDDALKEVQRAQMILQNSAAHYRMSSIEAINADLSNASLALRKVMATARRQGGRVSSARDLIAARNAILSVARRLNRAFVLE